MSVKAKCARIKVADEVWLATALLHRENPSRGLHAQGNRGAGCERGDRRRTATWCLRSRRSQHCVANRAPTPDAIACSTKRGPDIAACFVSATATIRNAKEARSPPERMRSLRATRISSSWYEDWSQSQGEKASESDPLLALYGSGKKLWADEHADEYVARLRAGWE